MEPIINSLSNERNSVASTQGRKVLIIEDEVDIAELMRYNLSLEGFDVVLYHSGEEGLLAIEKEKPDLLLLDLMLPNMDGLEICRRIKGNSNLKELPIIMVTAKGEESDIVRGLEMGADDYLSKPFSPKVLSARVKAVLRRLGGDLPVEEEGAVIKRGQLLIHPGRFEVKVQDEKVEMTNSEFQILYFLARRPGWVFTRSQIVDAVHGKNYAVTDRSVDFQMVGLRKKLGEMGEYIETVRGVGYRFRES